jgi:uridine kinase
MEKIAVLVSGVPRSFNKYLWDFLKKLPENYSFFINFSLPAIDKYSNHKINYDEIVNDKRTKMCIIQQIEIDISSSNILSQREKNTIYQWNKLYNLFKYVSSSYTKIVRIRPDVKFECTIESFVSMINSITDDKSIYIPSGYDIFDITAIRDLSNCVNDQIAVGYRSIMEHYCNLFNYLQYDTPIISEKQLYRHLGTINIIRIDIPYRLVLSECFVINLCGDSGAGKSTISQLISSVLPYDKSLLFETDRYHKWERGDKNYLEYTHLHPNANNLDKMAEDVYTLSLGKNIYTVDYDHSTGKFIYETPVHPSNYILICGLHTLYGQSLRELSDLKIYVDTEQTLKEHWKISRDINKRGASREQVKETIERRKPDYKTFIEPQSEHADVLIKYYPTTPGCFDNITLSITFKNAIGGCIIGWLAPLTNKIQYTKESVICIFDTIVDKEIITKHIERMCPEFKVDLKDGYDSIIQYCILAILWNC